MRRRGGSVRFDPYFKVQVLTERDRVGRPLGAWVDAQRSFDTPELAIAALGRGELEILGRRVGPDDRWRLMRIAEGGRAPYVPGVDSPTDEGRA